jgi:hypothetical protein
VIRLLATSQGDKDHILQAGLLDLSGGDEPPGIAQQDDLQQNFGIVGRASRLIVAVFLFKPGGIQALFHQRVDGKLTRSRAATDLPRKLAGKPVDGNRMT